MTFKTLNELKGRWNTWDEVVKVEDLRSEAIKWIKNRDLKDSVKGFIIEFFNLTEEDLL